MFSFSVFLQLLKEKQRDVKDLHSMNGGIGKCINADKYSPGCASCQAGTNLMIFTTLRCNLNCKCCPQRRPFYPLSTNRPELDDEDIRIESPLCDDIRFLAPMISLHPQIKSASYTGGEPFLVIPKIKKISDIIKQQIPDLYQWIYSNGLLITKDKLEICKEIGINEIRFDWAATNYDKNMISKMELISKYIPRITIEVPMYNPELIRSKFLPQINDAVNAGASCINCIELLINKFNDKELNLSEDEIYKSIQGGTSPYWSRLLTYEIMKYVQDHNIDICVNDCSNDTRALLNINRRKNGINVME